VIGFLQRSVTFEHDTYFWEEYLLYNARQSFRWLVRSDNHWSFVEPLPPGKVQADPTRAHYEGRTFKVFQKAPARVEAVLGEFYWKVHVEELVQSRDYVRPPQMLSREKTLHVGEQVGAEEISWSLGTYLPRGEVQKAFGLKDPLPVPSTIAPNQPFPYKRV